MSLEHASERSRQKLRASAMAGSENTQDEWLRPREAAAHIKSSESTLAKKRLRGNGPTYTKFGRLVLYAKRDLDEYLTSRRRRSRGASLLGERPGFARARHAQAQRSRMMTSPLFIDHALEIADFMVALELSAAAAGVELIHAYTLLESAPTRTSKRVSPWMWETCIRRGREERSVWMEPDQMFGLSFSDKRATQFYFLECDRGTMPVERKNLSKTSFLRKFLSYADTRKRGLHTKTYGLSNFTVLTVAPTVRRMHNLIDAHQRHTKGAVHPNLFLFIDRPSLLRSRDVFALPWLNGNGKHVRLVP